MSDLSEGAFGELYRETSRSLWAYVYRSIGHAADADDVVQEAFLRVLAANVGELSNEDLRRYLFRTTSNLMADRWRRSTRERHAAQQIEPDVHAEPRMGHESDMTRTFAQLKPRDRALLWLAYVEEQDHGQMAATLGVGRGSVKVLLSRARNRLRGLLRSAKALTV